MKKSYRFLGKERRITIPDELCLEEDWKQGTLVSFERLSEGTIVIRKEQICNNCCITPKDLKATALRDLLNKLSMAEKRAAPRHLLKILLEFGEQ